jgi:hypothetical protein
VPAVLPCPAAARPPRSAARTGTTTTPGAHHESTRCMIANSRHSPLNRLHHKIVDRTRIFTWMASMKTTG